MFDQGDPMRDSVRLGLLPLVARLFLVAEFLVAVNGKITDWSGQASYMASRGMHFVAPLLAAALAIELVGSICLITGFRARAAAATLCIYLGIVSVQLHDFWNRTGNSAGANQTEFFKNLGMMGGLLMVAVYGPGLWALGRREETAATSVSTAVSP
jgi:putative oxidoreductase